MKKFLDGFRLIVCLVLLTIVADLGREIYTRSAVQQVRKYDLANINHMKYGFFNVNLWKKKLATIVVSEIQRFKVDDRDKEVLKKQMEAQLDVLIDKVNEQIRESNKDSTKGWIRQKLMDMLIDVKQVKEGIPTYADAIVNKLTSPETQADLKGILKEKVSKYLRKTYEVEDSTDNDAIIQRIGATDMEDAKVKLARIVPAETDYLFRRTWAFIGCAILLFFLCAYHGGRKIPQKYFFIAWSLLFILLFVGLNCPMIDMDARISKFGFVLLGYDVEFLNQTVYFQSKSILDVFWIMIQHEKPEMRFVGVLLVMFSVIFPLVKLALSVVYYYDFKGLRNTRLVKTMVLKSGKWSMADVLAVAILMSYIGFNGMVTTQMEIMKKAYKGVDFISTNATTLQIGLYVFVAYVLLSMIFSYFVEKSVERVES